MLATILADYTAAKNYVAVHYKQLIAAIVASKYVSALVAAVTAIVHAL